MAKVWVQVWTAKVAGSVEVEESELQKVQGLESVSKLIPMLVKVSEHSGWEMVPNWGKQSVVVEPSQSQKVQDLQLAEELVEVLEPWRD
jgi:predicted amidohydrolase YtcJ